MTGERKNVKKLIALLPIALLAQVSASVLANEPAGSHARALKPLTQGDFKAKPPTKAKPAPGVREHLNLEPVTAEEFKAGPRKNGKSGPGIRDHLNLKPLTADEFKHAAGTPRR